tara:strand:- start:414 stop:683 length:270 start_codon:yes stop_codon:yes gene_type:complete
MAYQRLIPISIAWGVKNYDKVMTAIGEGALATFVYDQLFDEEVPEESSNIVIDSQTKKLLEDIIITNKANLILRNVRQDLYEPLNIDAQ